MSESIYTSYEEKLIKDALGQQREVDKLLGTGQELYTGQKFGVKGWFGSEEPITLDDFFQFIRAGMLALVRGVSKYNIEIKPSDIEIQLWKKPETDDTCFKLIYKEDPRIGQIYNPVSGEWKWL